MDFNFNYLIDLKIKKESIIELDINPIMGLLWLIPS